MSKDEPLEERKLLAVKSWFSRSVSSISSNNGSVEAVVDGNSSSVSVSKEGMVDNGTGNTPLRQLSMRRSRPSVETEKESGTGSPSVTPRNITPLTPLTPLRWKSNPREQEEEEKAVERSRLGSMGSVVMPHDGYLGVQPAVSNGKEERAPEKQPQGVSVHGAAAFDCTKSVDELSLKAQAGNVDRSSSPESPEGPDRKLSSGDDVMTMTIEFLRARLLSERSASRAAKLKVQQLVTKVSELEQKLDQAIEDRKKAEVAAQEAVMKLKLAESSNQFTEKAPVEVSDKCTLNPTKSSPVSSSKSGREDTKFLQPDSSIIEDLSRTNSNGSSVEDRHSTTKNQLPEIVSKIHQRTVEEGRSGMKPALQNSSERTPESPQNQNSRAALEIRLRSMWSKISEEMTALAEERGDEVVVREEIMSWMDQVPTVLQDIISKKEVSPSHDVRLRSEKEMIKPHDVPRIVNEGHSAPSPQVAQGKGQFQGDARREALLHEQFAAQESVQREWNRNYQEYQRKLGQGDDLNGIRSPNASARPREYQHGDRRHGSNDLVDDPSFLGSHHARLAKSKSTLDLPTRPNEYSSDMNSPHREGPHVESDSWNLEGPRRHRTSGRHPDSVHGQIPNDPTHVNHNRMFQDRSAAPSMLLGAGHEPWLGRKSDQETALYYEESGNRTYSQGGYPPHAEGLPDRPQFSTNRSAEDGYRNSQPDLRAGQPTWDDKDRGYSGESNRIERDGFYRGSEREDFFQPDSARRHRHRHRRSHSDSNDWPAVEDYGLLHQQHEPSPGLGRRQSYSGYPAAMASDLSPNSFEKTSGAYDDLRHSDERMHEARGQRRDSFPVAKVDNAFRHQYSAQNFYPSAEPTLSLGYGPAYDAPRESSPVQQGPKNGVNKNVSDVLRALQMAKANIQSGSKVSKEQRLSGDRASLKTGYGMEHSAQYMQTIRQTSPEQLRYSESQQPQSESSRAAFYKAKYDPCDTDPSRERYQMEGDAISGTNANSSYVDQLNVGKGIQFFFPG